MNFSINYSDFVFKEKKNLYLILLLPLTLFLGSAVTNVTTIAIIVLFLLDYKKEDNFFFYLSNFKFKI